MFLLVWSDANPNPIGTSDVEPRLVQRNRLFGPNFSLCVMIATSEADSNNFVRSVTSWLEWKKPNGQQKSSQH